MVQLDKRVLSKSKTKLIGAGVRDSCGKARAWSGNQRSNYTIP